MKTTCYLILQGRRSYRGGPISSVRVVATRQSLPSLGGNEIAVKVTVELPPEAFDPAEVAVVISPRDVALGIELEEPEPTEELELEELT